MKELEKEIRLSLIQAGFINILPVTEARKISNEVLKNYVDEFTDVRIELAPIHSVGGRIACNCKTSEIKIIKKLKQKPTTNKT